MAQLNIGLGQARRLCSISHTERLAVVADGLPTILESAQGLWVAACQLKEMPRESEVLAGFAEEEAAKILILMDLVRCPQARSSARVGRIIRWFYEHLARLIYAEAAHWKPVHMGQLREYVDGHRKAHYVEGYAGEYILPNWSITRREALLYADVEASEGGTLSWNKPQSFRSDLPLFKPTAIVLAEAFLALGLLSEAGLNAIADVFGQIDFVENEHPGDAEELTRALLERVIAEGLPSAEASTEHIQTLYRSWQMPMYNLEFSRIDVPLEDLENERQSLFWSEAGYP